MKTNHINSVMHVAEMPHWKTVKNLTLFAEEVMPRLQTSVPAQPSPSLPSRGGGDGKFTRAEHTSTA